MDLKQLAAEREARAKARGATEGPAAVAFPNPWGRPAAPNTAGRGGVGSSGGGGGAARAASQLEKVHRSIRFAHSLGLLSCVFGILLMLCLANRSWGALVVFSGVVLARAGGSFVHNFLPACLREGGAPTDAEVTAATSAGLFCLDGLRAPGESLASEWSVLVENLAFACTYGKRNCLTGQMYAGPITLGKVCGLVYDKLSQGVFRCS
mmetsp:Transcript_118491/g.335123  ORF Transcript_118491/g.335123 Transcript_118491/m.335123 type:complete len:208 (-) Transcript_118491:36-659(-)